MKDVKKKIVAVAAVVNYIKTQESAVVLTVPQIAESDEKVKDSFFSQPLSLNVWGLSGRQQQMQLRSMMQLKAFHGSKKI